MLEIDGTRLTLPELRGYESLRPRASLAAAARDRMQSSVDAVERAVARGDVTYGINNYAGKNPEAVAKFIAAMRKTLEFGSKNKDRVAEMMQKAANMKPDDAKAYASQWDGAYMASFEAADVASLKRMQEIVKAAGSAKTILPSRPS